jgi:hypothetical protein
LASFEHPAVVVFLPCGATLTLAYLVWIIG